MKCSVFIATSVDGFIARENGDIEWLNQASASMNEGNEEGNIEDGGYSAFINTIDMIVMGRKSFEKVLSFGEWAYGKMPMIVLSRNIIEIPERLQPFVSSSSESPIDLVKRLDGMGVKHVYVDGGNTIQRFLRAKLIDDMTITSIPILLGDGISLFRELEKDIFLSLVNSITFKNGFLQATYQVKF